MNQLRISIEIDYQFDKDVFCKALVDNSQLLHVIGTVLKFNDQGRTNVPEYYMKVDAIVILLCFAMVPGEIGVIQTILSP